MSKTGQTWRTRALSLLGIFIVVAAVKMYTEVSKPSGGSNVVIEDKSWATEQYIDHGVPSPVREWSADDMQRAKEAIAAIVAEDAAALPHYKSKNSGEIFARIINVDNFNILRNHTLPITLRLPMALGYGNELSALMKTYLAAASKRLVTNSDLIELQAATLRLLVIQGDLLDEFVPTLDKNDPSYGVRMDGLRQAKQGFSITLSGFLVTLSDLANGNGDEEDLDRLVDHICENFPALVSRCDDGSRREFQQRLKSLSKHDRLKRQSARLSDLAERLKAETVRSTVLPPP